MFVCFVRTSNMIQPNALVRAFTSFFYSLICSGQLSVRLFESWRESDGPSIRRRTLRHQKQKRSKQRLSDEYFCYLLVALQFFV